MAFIAFSAISILESAPHLRELTAISYLILATPLIGEWISKRVIFEHLGTELDQYMIQQPTKSVSPFIPRLNQTRDSGLKQKLLL